MIDHKNLNEIYTTAYNLAKVAFLGKEDKGGESYFGHLQRVSDRCYKGVSAIPCEESIFVTSAALLHDLLEDCQEWNEKSLSFIFPKEVVDLVVILTKAKNEPYLDSYIKRISENKLASRIKLSDLRDNMDITRLSEITQKDIDRLFKYHTAYKILEKCI